MKGAQLSYVMIDIFMVTGDLGLIPQQYDSCLGLPTYTNEVISKSFHNVPYFNNDKITVWETIFFITHGGSHGY